MRAGTITKNKSEKLIIEHIRRERNGLNIVRRKQGDRSSSNWRWQGRESERISEVEVVSLLINICVKRSRSGG